MPLLETSEQDRSLDYSGVYRNLSKLPPFPASALKLLSVSSEGHTAMGDFEKIFRSDPALTADLLMVANSAQFGSRARIESIRHALIFLGLDRARSLASTIALGLALRKTPFKESVQLVWSHSIASAVIAEELGTLHNVAGMYTAALTHDLGRLGLLITVGRQYELVFSETFEDMADANRSEKTWFGMTHCQAGSLVAEKWGFPIGLQTGMAAHHDDVPMSPPRRLLQTACRLADSLGYTEVKRRDLTEETTEWESAGLSPDATRDLVEKRIALLRA